MQKAIAYAINRQIELLTMATTTTAAATATEEAIASNADALFNYESVAKITFTFN